MSLFKFENGDVIKNTIVTNPKNKFLIYNGITVYNDSVQELQTNSSDLTKFIPPGHISLYELNIDRPTGSGDSNMIRPFTTTSSNQRSTTFAKVQQLNAFGEVDEYIATRVNGELVPASASIVQGQVILSQVTDDDDRVTVDEYLEFLKDNDINEIYGTYPLSSSIYPRRVDVSPASINSLQNYVSKLIEEGVTTSEIDDIIVSASSDGKRLVSYEQIADEYKRSLASSLQNTINYYSYMSKNFDAHALYSDDFNIISIPSVFFGDKIKPGSVRLSYLPPESTEFPEQYLTDSRRNGELIDQNGQFCGIVLYNEGFVILSQPKQSSENDTREYLLEAYGSIHHRWANFGMTAGEFAYYAWSIEFDGVNEIPSVTMFAHAKKSELNHSNNPSWLKVRKTIVPDSERRYVEPSNREIRNITKNELVEADPVFKKETYISKIAIYDKHKKIIGYAKLARPIRKTEERELTFKLKLDL